MISSLPLLLSGLAQATPLTRPDRDGSFLLPPSASTVAPEVDFVWNYILYVDLVFFAILMGAMVLFFFRYKQKVPGEKTADIRGNHTLEVVWSVFPGILLVLMFYLGFKGWMNLAVPPADAMEVRVLGQKWNWTFTYTDPATGKSFQTTELIVPSGKPVKLTMNSKDVLHSFYIPDFRVKKDVLPNRYTVLWFEAPHEGEHNIFCTEYCGDAHSKMLNKVKVIDQQDFRVWMNKELSAGDGPPSGEKLFTLKGCAGCHSIDGSPKVGPTLKGKWGIEETLADGTKALVDDNYVRESIMTPAVKVVAGFSPSMPPYKGQLSDDETNALIDYIKSLGQQ